MKPDAGIAAAAFLCSLLLTGSACAAAAPVTHGDLMLSGGTPFRLQFRVPEGKGKATDKVNGCKQIWGRTVSQDGRYAAVGCSFQRLGTKAQPGERPSFLSYIGDPVKVVLLQLIGPSPKEWSRSNENCGTTKVLGARILPGYNNGTTKGCFYADADRTPYVSSPLALRSRILPGAAGADEGWYFGASAVQHWTITHSKFKTLGALVTAERAAFRDKVKCGAEGLSVAVTADGKVYAAFGYNVAKPEFFDTIGVYEVRRSLKGGSALLVPTWKFKTGILSFLKFLPTGPVTGCAIAEEPSVDFVGTKIYSFAKGQVPYVGGISTAIGDRAYWDISCKGAVVYATLHVSKAVRLLKVSTGLLKKGATGRVLFNAPASAPDIVIVP